MSVNVNNANLDSIVEIIESNNDLIEYDYRGHENQILIPKVIVKEINRLISTFGLKEEEFKEITKQSIKRGFELSGNDIVISKNGEFFIKLFEKTKKHKVDEKDKNTIANRYNGIEEEELEGFYDEFFQEAENKNFFARVAKEFVKTYLTSEKITNEVYEKNVFSYIHTITFKRLVEIYDDSDGFFTGFAGYIFRIHFKEVFEHIADLVLGEIAISNKSIIDFLKYYSQDIIVVNGKKYKVPSLESKDGLRWNVGSMLSITKIYIKSSKMVKSLQQESQNLNTQVKKLYIGNLTPLDYQSAQIQKRQSFDNDIAHYNKKLERYVDILNQTSDEDEKSEMKKEIHSLKDMVSNLLQDKKELSEESVDKGTLSQYTHIQKEIDTLRRHLKREQLIITQNKNAYQSIRESLIKALISKKQLL